MIREHKCIICSSESFFLKSVNEFDIYKCSSCALEYVNPMPSESCLKEFYSQYLDIRAQNEVTARNALRNLAFIENELSIQNKRSILDFGCGNNMFVETCRQNGFLDSYGFDQYIDAAPDEKRVSKNSYLDQKWDVVTLWGVLEHVKSPISLMFGIKECLSEDGLIVLTTIFTESSIPFQYKPPEHTLYFTKDSLEDLAESVGLTIVKFENYHMVQSSDVYLSILLRTVPNEYKTLINHQLPEFVEVPTNEVRVVLKKARGSVDD